MNKELLNNIINIFKIVFMILIGATILAVIKKAWKKNVITLENA